MLGILFNLKKENGGLVDFKFGGAMMNAISTYTSFAPGVKHMSNDTKFHQGNISMSAGDKSLTRDMPIPDEYIFQDTIETVSMKIQKLEKIKSSIEARIKSLNTSIDSLKKQLQS